MASYSNSTYSNSFYDLTGVYFNSTNQSSSSVDLDQLDARYLIKSSGGTISNNLIVSGSVDIQTSLTIPNIGNVENSLDGKQDVIDDGDLSISKTNGLQTALTELDEVTESHTEDLATNTADILTKQDLITSATDLECNSLTTGDLEVNGNITKKTYFDTIVVRRPTGVSGVGSDRIGVKELQCWVNGVNIMTDNGLTSYFASWLDKDTDTGPQNVATPSTLAHNNSLEDLGGLSSSTEGLNAALIIKNIPTTSIHNIQAIVFYSRDSNDTLQTTVGLGIELYNSTNDPNLTTPLASTPVITATALLVYRYDFPSIDTYTDFVGVNSIANIVNNTFAFAQVIVVSLILKLLVM